MSREEGASQESEELGPSQGSGVIGQSGGPFSRGTKAAPSAPLGPESGVGKASRLEGLVLPAPPTPEENRASATGGRLAPKGPQRGSSHPQKRWMRMWTKSVAGDSEAPSLESRWMWRYPVGRGATCPVLCPPQLPTLQGQGRGGTDHLPPQGSARGKLSEDIQGPGEQGLAAQNPSLSIHTHLASGY